MRHKPRVIATLAACLFNTSWRIVLEGREADLALPQTKLACVAARTDRGVQLHREAWHISAHYCLDMRYALRVLHFSAFQLDNCCALLHTIWMT